MIEIFIIGLTFLGAGFVKGTVGIGLPTISVAVLAAVIGLDQAIAVSLLPSLASNLWQAVVGGAARPLIRRLWHFLLPAILTVWIGALALTRIDLDILSGILGLALVLYAGANLSGVRPALSASAECWAGPMLGALNGILTGMTGSYVVPGVMYLQSIGLNRNERVQAMGILFTLSTIALAASMGGAGLIFGSNVATSLIALVPVGIGMMAGQRIRTRLSEHIFRRATMISLLVLGVYLAVRIAL